MTRRLASPTQNLIQLQSEHQQHDYTIHTVHLTGQTLFQELGNANSTLTAVYDRLTSYYVTSSPPPPPQGRACKQLGSRWVFGGGRPGRAVQDASGSPWRTERQLGPGITYKIVMSIKGPCPREQ